MAAKHVMFRSAAREKRPVAEATMTEKPEKHPTHAPAEPEM